MNTPPMAIRVARLSNLLRCKGPPHIMSVSGSSRARLRNLAATVAVVALALAMTTGCGADLLDPDEFKYDDPQSMVETDSAADAGPKDTSGQADTGSTDAGEAKDTGGGDKCLTDFDCLNIPGKTPCKVPWCDKGACKLKQHKEGTKCSNPLVTLGECEKTSCDAKGQCVVNDRPDKKHCGFGVCGKHCMKGKCVVAPADAYDDDNPCTKDFCKQGSEIVHEPFTDLSLACDDNNPCTEKEYCAAGKCLGSPAD